MSENKKNKPKKEKSVFHKKSEAGKGDKPRQGISQEEWGDKWEKIFRPKSVKKRDSIQVVRKRK
jgi:hypothetical protein